MWLTQTNLENKDSYRGRFFPDFCIFKEKLKLFAHFREAVSEKQMAVSLVRSMWKQKLSDDI